MNQDRDLKFRPFHVSFVASLTRVCCDVLDLINLTNKIIAFETVY